MTPPTVSCFFIAPTCAGKGFVMKLLHDFLLLAGALNIIRIGMISFGDIVKGLLETDDDFRKQYAERMMKGDLIDDPKAIEIFQREVDRLMENPPDFIFVDGFGRSTSQLAYAMNKGYLDKNAKVFMIEVSQATCMERFLHRKQKPGKPRIDAEIDTFNKRYDLHRDTSPDLRAMIKEGECQLVDVDGEGDILNDIARQIKENLLPDFIAVALRRMGQTQEFRV